MSEKITAFKIKEEAKAIIEANEPMLIFLEHVIPTLEETIQELEAEINKELEVSPEAQGTESYKAKVAVLAGVKAHADKVKGKIASLKATNIVAQVEAKAADKCNFTKLLQG